MQNIQNILKRTSLEAAHVEISTLDDNEILKYCLDNNIHIRTWALLERNPEKDDVARQNILRVIELAKKYPNLYLDIITDYAPIITGLLNSF